MELGSQLFRRLPKNEWAYAVNDISLLKDITGIENIYLRLKAEIRNAPASLKFSWAAMRETSRPEDLAYCMLGLLQVNMPLLYGEGENAFRRLQEEVFKRRQDLSILAWGFDMTWQEIKEQSSFKGLLLSGPFAPSIRNYKRFPKSCNKNIKFFEPTTHSMITNLGLNISLPLMCIDSSLGIYLAFISVWGEADSEAFALPLLKRDKGDDSQIFEHIPGSPHLISLREGTIRRKTQLKTIYLIESRAVFPVWSRPKQRLFLSENLRHRAIVIINHEQIDEAGFEVSNVFPPPIYYSSPTLKWRVLPGYFEIIMIFSRALSDCCVVRIQGRSTDRGKTAVPQISIACCESSSFALKYVNNSRWRNPLAMIERPWIVERLKWRSEVSFEPIPRKAPVRASIEMEMIDVQFHFYII